LNQSLTKSESAAQQPKNQKTLENQHSVNGMQQEVTVFGKSAPES
jgi:hypothetical protein